MTSERIGLLIDSLPQLQGLNRQVRRLLALQDMLTEVLPDSLASSTTVALSAADELVLFVDNGAAAAKLKQLTPRILVFFRQRGHEVTAIRVQVQVRIRHNPLPQKQISLSSTARQAISELSATLDASPLKSALERLGRRKMHLSDHHD
ncbi:MAG TPA: DciA family protein [Burkholderiales bacterium]|nr:DciA family protein [Burkholderiales bacterium]